MDDEPKQEDYSAEWTELDALIDKLAETQRQTLEPVEHMVFEGMEYL